MQMQTSLVETGNTSLQLSYDYLMQYALQYRNSNQLACMLASLCNGQGGMPVRLGLSVEDFEHMMDMYFPGADIHRFDKEKMAEETDRTDEQDELYLLLTSHKADSSPDNNWIARIVMTGCMGGNHLWQDLGLWSRQQLTEMMEHSFPSLSVKNDKNMKWKKFLYKQLCIQEGIYTCRSPSCEVCVDYKECFGPE